MKDKKKPANESSQICKVREKLKKKMEAIERKITQQALEKKSFEIHRHIAKSGSDRMLLHAKDISLFDENQNTAQVSRKVSVLAEKIQNELSPLQELMQKKEQMMLE